MFGLDAIVYLAIGCALKTTGVATLAVGTSLVESIGEKLKSPEDKAKEATSYHEWMLKRAIKRVLNKVEFEYYSNDELKFYHEHKDEIMDGVSKYRKTIIRR